METREPRVTERDVALLMLSDESLLNLGALLAFQARAVLGGRSSDALLLETEALPA